MSKKQGLLWVLIMISAIVLISYNRNNDQDYKYKQPDIAENKPMAEYADSQCIESHNTIDINAVQSLLELGNKTVKDPGYHYFVRRCWNLGNICRVYGIDGVDTHKYFVPVLQIEIPDDREKEERINKMLLERYVAVLPDDTAEEWWEQQEIRITYRSERYLCFRYFSSAALPKGYSDKDLYFTLDLENESIIAYPGIEGQVGKFEPDTSGNLYRELEAYQEKTVEEQSALRSDGMYQVHETMTECDGISFPCVEVEGLEDEEKQKQINLALQEPLRTLIENGVWEKNKILDWFYVMGMYEEGNWQYRGEKYEGLGLLLQTEKQKVIEYKYNLQKNNIVELDECSWLQGMTDWDSFYLYKGKLAILRLDSYYDFEIPLPELYEYLKVDPWYD